MIRTQKMFTKKIVQKKIGRFFEKYSAHEIGFFSDGYMLYGLFIHHISSGTPLFLPFHIYMFLPPYEFSKPRKNHVLSKIHLIT